MQTYHNKTVQQTAELLGTDIKTGLTHDEIKKRLHHYGKNELIEKKIRWVWAPQYLSVGTRTSPMESCSTLYSTK